ncbi:MAG: hypothetical protein RR816_14380, partial [Clostridia bacterium]
QETRQIKTKKGAQWEARWVRRDFEASKYLLGRVSTKNEASSLYSMGKGLSMCLRGFFLTKKCK